MDDTVWSQIGGLFDGFFRYSVLFLVFTVFTSSGFVPPALRAGFLRGVIICTTGRLTKNYTFVILVNSSMVRGILIGSISLATLELLKMLIKIQSCSKIFIYLD